jgi:hypothetical protein
MPGEINTFTIAITNNMKAIYFDMLFKFLKKINISEEDISRLNSCRKTILNGWNALISRVIYIINKGSRDFSSLKPNVGKCLDNEKKYRDVFIEIIERCNLEGRLNEYSKISKEHLIIKNLNLAEIIQESNKVTIKHSKNQVYNIWTVTNDAPQILISMKGKTNFSIEARVNANCKTGIEYQSGLILKMADGRKYLFGSCSSTDLKIFCPENKLNYAIYHEEITGDSLILRMKKEDSLYSFYYKKDKGESWIKVYEFNSEESAGYFGLFSKTWAPLEYTVEFEDIQYSF